MKIIVKIGEDTAENVMKNVIMKFQCNPVTHDNKIQALAKT